MPGKSNARDLETASICCSARPPGSVDGGMTCQPHTLQKERETSVRRRGLCLLVDHPSQSVSSPPRGLDSGGNNRRGDLHDLTKALGGGRGRY